MINGVYLSDAINLEELQYGCINLISTNCGSGKTHFAINKLAGKASCLSHVVYLTDSVAMRDSLSKEDNCKIYHSSDKDIINGKMTTFDEGKIIVMTYAKMGLLLKYYPNAFDAVEIIICDEIHRIPEFIEMSRIDIAKKFPGTTKEEQDYWISVSCGAYLAANHIEQMAAGLDLSNLEQAAQVKKLIVSLSATPAKAFIQFGQRINEIRINAQLIAYETLHTIFYTDLASIIQNLEKGTKAIFYVPRISLIIKSINLANELGFKANGIWSISNTEHKMDDEQKRIRKYILEEHKLPEEYDFIFINAAYETSINIFGNIDCAVIHTTDPDKRIQARNRYRGDLKTQFLLANDEERNTLYVPIDFLNKPLDKEEKKALCEIIKLKDKSYNKLGWPTTKKFLIEHGYDVIDKRTTRNGIRGTYSTITLKEEA